MSQLYKNPEQKQKYLNNRIQGSSTGQGVHTWHKVNPMFTLNFLFSKTSPRDTYNTRLYAKFH